jgi:hypothetical protein
MRFYWIRDRVKQNQFHILWKKGSENLADYFTKHHPPAHHQRMRSRYLQQNDVVTQQSNMATDHNNNNEHEIHSFDKIHLYERSNATPTEEKIHCEGVLNNIGTPPINSHAITRPINYPATTSVPPFPRTQALPDSSPCSYARLIEDPNTDRYWPITATITGLLVGQDSSNSS